MIKKMLLLSCASLILLSIFPIELFAENKGAEVLITRIDHSQISGELIAVKSNSILILNSENDKDLSVPLTDIWTVKIIKRAKPLRGAGLGFLGGAATGFFYGLINPGDAEPDSLYPKLWALVFSGPGILIGLITEGIFAKDRTYLIKGRPPQYQEADLKKLRSKARVKDFN
jgi:hypothetical protein